MAYTTIDKPSDYFETVLYTGNGSTQSITSLDFQPDWVWLKQRNTTRSHWLFDSVRGATKRLHSEANSSEATDTSTLTSFNSNGFSLGSSVAINQSSGTYASWNWKAGTSFTNDASATGIGTIDSTGSVNDTSGFSIVSYSGTGGAGTIKHGLSTVPSMIIVKVRTGRTSDWLVYHKGIASDAETDCIKLNESNAAFDEATIWNDTAPTSSVFSVGTEDTVSGSGNTFIAYCFAEKQGFSKFGSYVGNGSSDGVFCFTGMKPSFVMIKETTNSSTNWIIYDNKRDIDNPAIIRLFPNDSQAEISNSGVYDIDLLSNGFKIKTTNNNFNRSGANHIYMAFAESPFVSSTGVPTTAK